MRYEMTETTLTKPPTFVDDLFGKVSGLRQKLAYSKLRKELDKIMNKVKGLEEFGVEAGDPRYVELKLQTEVLLTKFLLNNSNYSMPWLEAEIPALEYISSMAEKNLTPSQADMIKERVKQGLTVIVGGIVAGFFALCVIGPIVTAAMVHWYHLWLRWI